MISFNFETYAIPSDWLDQIEKCCIAFFSKFSPLSKTWRWIFDERYNRCKKLRF